MAKSGIQRQTRQRQVVLEELQKVTSHPTAAALFAMVSRRLPKISLGTVYRNLELLSQMGLIQKLQVAGSEAHYDGNPMQHDHLRCVQCGRVDDVSALPFDLPGGATHDWNGYEILGYRLEVLGLCPDCRAKKAAEEGENSSDLF
jgi:Fur family ferric uptake transcriptional regulator